MDLMDQGDLTKIILAKQGDFSEDFCKWSLYCVAQGIKAMHDKNVLHRDVKSDNILCSANGDIKLADLGFSVFLSEQSRFRSTRRGTPSWISPEIANNFCYSKEVDVWAFGCFAFELATGYPPFHRHSKDISLLLNAIIHESVADIPDKWSDDFKDFVSKCLIKDS